MKTLNRLIDELIEIRDMHDNAGELPVVYYNNGVETSSDYDSASSHIIDVDAYDVKGNISRNNDPRMEYFYPTHVFFI